MLEWFSKPNMAIHKEFGKKLMKKDECVSKDTYLELQKSTFDFLHEVERQITAALNCLKGRDAHFSLKRSRTVATSKSESKPGGPFVSIMNLDEVG